MQSIITDNRDQIIELCKTHHVRRLSAFGSAVRDDFDPERSDVDLLIEFEALPFPSSLENKRDLDEKLVRLLMRLVDLIPEGSIDNPFLLREINADRKLLYAA
jgi:predicted nucleotidyltransferase